MILGKDMHTLVVLWIQCCAILQNLLLEDGYDSNWVGGIEDLDGIVSNDTLEGSNETLSYNDAFAKNKKEIIKAKGVVLSWRWYMMYQACV